MEQMEQDYFAVLKLDNVLTRLTTTMAEKSRIVAANVSYRCYRRSSNTATGGEAALLQTERLPGRHS